NSARSANGRATTKAYVSYPSKIHPRKLAASMRQCFGVRSVYQGCDADRTEATEFIKLLLLRAGTQKKGRLDVIPRCSIRSRRSAVPTDQCRVRNGLTPRQAAGRRLCRRLRRLGQCWSSGGR